MHIRREWMVMAGLAAVWALAHQKPPVGATVGAATGPTSIVAPPPATGLAAPYIGGSQYFPSIGGFAGAAVGGTYAGRGAVNSGSGYGLLPAPNWPSGPISGGSGYKGIYTSSR